MLRGMLWNAVVLCSWKVREAANGEYDTRPADTASGLLASTPPHAALRCQLHQHKRCKPCHAAHTRHGGAQLIPGSGQGPLVSSPGKSAGTAPQSLVFHSAENT